MVFNRRYFDYLIIAFLSIILYSQHYNYGYNIGDEGSLAYISQALLEGQVPYIDISIGYNIMWYYPIVFLFYIFGINFIVLKIYLFALAAINAMLGFHIAYKLTRMKFLAWIVAIMFLLIPGPIHKIYIPLISSIAIFALMKINVKNNSIKGLIPISVCIAISSLFRIEIAIMLFFIAIAVLFFHYFSIQEPRKFIFFSFMKSLVSMISYITLLLFPFSILAYFQGFLSQFINNYLRWFLYLINSFIDLIDKAQSNLSRTITGESSNSIVEKNITKLQRISLDDLFNGSGNEIYIFLTYLPMAIFTFLILRFLFLILLSYLNKTSIDDTIKSSLIIQFILFFVFMCSYLQFFFFRPDIHHLVQAMPPFIILIVFFIYKTLLNIKSNWNTKSMLSFIKLTASTLCLLCSFFYLYTYTAYSFDKGRGIGIRSNKIIYKNLIAENGVDLHINSQLHNELEEIKNIILSNSKKSDFLVCYPYLPGINFMTNRKTCKPALYIDNTAVLSNPKWNEKEIKLLNDKNVKIVVAQHNWAINGTQFSKFNNWAKELHEYLKNNYHFIKKEGKIQVFLRKND